MRKVGIAMISSVFGFVSSGQAQTNPPVFTCSSVPCVVFVAAGIDAQPVAYDSTWPSLNFASTWIKGQKGSPAPGNPANQHVLMITGQDPGSGKSITYWAFVDTPTLCSTQWGKDDLAPAAKLSC